MVTLVIIEENEILRMGLRGVVQSSDEIEVIGEYAGISEAMSDSNSLVPDVVLLGVVGTGDDKSRAFRKVSELWPEAKTLSLSEQTGDDGLYEAIQSGASGSVSRVAGGAELNR